MLFCREIVCITDTFYILARHTDSNRDSFQIKNPISKFNQATINWELKMLQGDFSKWTFTFVNNIIWAAGEK